MPEKDPGQWMHLWYAMPEPIKASLLSMAVAVARVMYDDKEPRLVRRALEASLCGLITFTVGSGIETLGLSGGYAMFAGGAIGLLGADTARELGQRLAKRKADGR